MVKIAKFVIPPPQNTTRAAKDTYRRRKQAPLAQGASGDRPVTAWGASAVYPQKTDELSIPKKVSSSVALQFNSPRLALAQHFANPPPMLLPLSNSFHCHWSSLVNVAPKLPAKGWRAFRFFLECYHLCSVARVGSVSRHSLLLCQRADESQLT
jgi:hypothetical protein